MIRYGLKGSADITGIANTGKRCEFEIKTGAAQQSDAQVYFEAMIKKNNGHYFVVRSVEQALDCLHSVAAVAP